jgi:para-nitrobenzyl esterase
MEKLMKKGILISVAVILAAALVGLILVYQLMLKPVRRVYEAAPVTERVTASGKVIGFIEDNDAHGWLGIPYAKAPVGELRWKAPRPADPWEGTLEAVEVRPICTQYGGLLGDVSPLEFNKPVGEEDCLFLNLWAPAFTPDSIPQGGDRRPVMVWIHGGGNSVGHGGAYNGKVLAETHGVILVSFNYRLGPFGWFAHPALREEASTPEDESGNFGTLDILALLTWVGENISAFGGDPGNVTVFGESAGAMNTMSMLLSPEARGLFHRAVSQSGGLVTTVMSEAENYHDDEAAGHRCSSREVIHRLLMADNPGLDRESAKAVQDKMSNKEIAEYLRGKSNTELIRAYEPGPVGMVSMPDCFRDGHVLPIGVPLSLLASKNTYNAVPIILGTNRDENKTFMCMNPEYVGLLGVKDQSYYDMVAGYLDRGWKATGADEIAAVLTEAQGEDVYVYRFDWDEEPSLLGSDMGKLVGAGHALEIPFVFNNFEAIFLGFGLFYSDDNQVGRQALAESMSSYWAEFALTGSPGRGRDGSEVEWKAWDNADGADKFIILDTPADRGIRMSSDEVRLDELKQRLLEETRFKSQAKHCEAYVWIFGRHESWDDEEYANLGERGCGEYPKELFAW